MSVLHAATLQSARSLSGKVRELTFRPDVALPFVPGQWVSLRLPLEGAQDPLVRSYSIASAPRPDGTFDLAVTRVPDGPMSTRLHALAVGETVTLTAPQGFFTLPPALPPALLFVATGTGVAPIRAMLQHALAAGATTPMALVFGVQTEGDVLYSEEFRALAARHPNFRFEPTLSRGAASWTGRRGYVQTHVGELTASLEGCEVYACGLNAMVREVRKTLKESLGFGRERIHTERYD